MIENSLNNIDTPKYICNNYNYYYYYNMFITANFISLFAMRERLAHYLIGATVDASGQFVCCCSFSSLFVVVVVVAVKVPKRATPPVAGKICICVCIYFYICL